MAIKPALMGITQTMCTNCLPQDIFYPPVLTAFTTSVTNLGGNFFRLPRAIVVVLSTWDAEAGLLCLCDVVWHNVDLVRESLALMFLFYLDGREIKTCQAQRWPCTKQHVCLFPLIAWPILW